MQFKGTVEIAAPRDKVWAFLMDPNQVGTCGPGVECCRLLLIGAMGGEELGSGDAQQRSQCLGLDTEALCDQDVGHPGVAEPQR